MKSQTLDYKMPDTSQNIAITTIAKGAMAQLRSLVDVEMDSEVAKPIYRELLRLAHKLSHKHGFQLENAKKPIVINP